MGQEAIRGTDKVHAGILNTEVAVGVGEGTRVGRIHQVKRNTTVEGTVCMTLQCACQEKATAVLLLDECVGLLAMRHVASVH
jgi:hypothetical protein